MVSVSAPVDLVLHTKPGAFILLGRLVCMHPREPICGEPRLLDLVVHTILSAASLTLLLLCSDAEQSSAAAYGGPAGGEANQKLKMRSH
jgi:hypothetical protein